MLKNLKAMKTIKVLWIRFKDTIFYQTHKEEFVIIPVLTVAFFILNLVLSFIFPHSSLFDVPSQLETLFSYSLKITAVTTISWFAFRVSMPPLYRQIVKFYRDFDTMTENSKNIYAVVLLCVFLLAGAIISRGDERPGVRDSLKTLLDSQLYIRESGENRGVEVDRFNKAVGVPVASYWCGSYVAWNLNYFHIKNPSSAWSPAYANPKDVIWRYKDKNSMQPLLGDVFTEYYERLGRVGHTGFYLSTDKEGYFITQAGNTSGPGSRNGDRVGRHKISAEKIFAISRYINHP